MGKKCFFCEKRKAKYPTIVYSAPREEKEVELCCICYKKYKRLKEKALIKTYNIMTELTQQGK